MAGGTEQRPQPRLVRLVNKTALKTSISLRRILRALGTQLRIVSDKYFDFSTTAHTSSRKASRSSGGRFRAELKVASVNEVARCWGRGVRGESVGCDSGVGCMGVFIQSPHAQSCQQKDQQMDFAAVVAVAAWVGAFRCSIAFWQRTAGGCKFF
jgi:hypothetical protein